MIPFDYYFSNGSSVLAHTCLLPSQSQHSVASFNGLPKHLGACHRCHGNRHAEFRFPGDDANFFWRLGGRGDSTWFWGSRRFRASCASRRFGASCASFISFRESIGGGSFSTESRKRGASCGTFPWWISSCRGILFSLDSFRGVTRASVFHPTEISTIGGPGQKYHHEMFFFSENFPGNQKT